MRDRSKQLLVINTGKKPSELPSQSGNTHIIGGGGLPVNMSDYLLKSIWDKVFELKTDSQGTDYIFSKLPVVTQYGITMYSGDGVDIPSLASGLPFDGRTIWYNPNTNQIEVIGGTGGGSGEGVSNFWDLSGIPSWITISKPKYTYSEIEGTPDLSGFATQNWIISQGYASAEELKKYIPISGYTEVSGEKNFTGGLKVNGSPIYYDTEKKYWKLEGDLLVTGGVTMYGVDSTDIPSLINSLPVATTKEKGVAYFDPDFFSVSSDGKVSFIGETGGGLDITALQNYLTQNSYLNVTEGDNRYLKLSGGTLTDTLIINRSTYPHIVLNSTADNGDSCVMFDLKNVIKGYVGYSSALGVYLQNSTTNKKLSLFDDGSLSYGGSTIWHSGNDGADSGLDADLLDGFESTHFYISNLGKIDNQTDVASLGVGSYYVVEDKGLTNPVPSRYSSLSCFGKSYYSSQLCVTHDASSAWLRGIYNKPYEATSSDWHELAFTDSNVASATKLQNARTIWGQSFDGTGNVSGNMSGVHTILGFSSIRMTSDTSKTFGIWNGKSFTGALTEDDIAYNANNHVFIGNVGIGTAAPAYKLDINGVMRSIALKTGSLCIECDTLGETSNRTGEINRYGGVLHLQYNTPASISMCYGGGNVGVGMKNPSYKLDIAGSIRSNNVIINKEYSLFLSDRSEGIYVYGNGIAWHNSSNSWSASLISLAKDSITLHQNTTVQGSIITNDSVTINGIKLSKSKDGVLYLDGNLVVKGGVTMYGTDATSSPSIFDSLPVASTTTKGIAYFDSEFFSVGSDGKVSFIGKTDGFNATELQNYLTQNSYLNTSSGDNRYLKLSGGELTGLLTISRSAVGLVLDRTVSGNPHITYKCLGTAVGDIGVSTDGNPVFYSYNTKKWNNIWHEGNFNPSNYLPLSGGKMNASACISWDSAEGGEDYSAYNLGIKLLGYNANTSSYRGGIHVGTRYGWQLTRNGFSNTLECRMRNVDTNTFGYWKIIAFTDSNVASATKLQTPRTIWGQSFDGTGNVSGNMSGVHTILGFSSIRMTSDTSKTFGIWNGKSFTGALTEDDIAYNANNHVFIGNVGIGTAAPTDKLHVHGTLRLAENVPHTLRYHATGTYDAGLVVGTSGNECLAFIANQAVTSFMFVQGGTALKSWSSNTWKTQTPALQIKNNSVYVNSLIADGVTPTYRFLVNGTARIDQLDFSHSNEINAFYAEGEINPANLHLNYRSLGNVTLAYGGGNVGIGTITPSHKLHVVGNTYLNGDVFADELNTFDVLPRTNNAYSCGNSSLRWYQVYGNIGDFSGAVSMGSTLNVTGMTTMTNATITGYLRLKDSTNYGRAIYFGDGELCYLEEASDDVLTIYANAGIKLNTSSTSYNVSINTNLLVSGGITMYSQRSLKNIQDERGLSLGELRAIKPIRYTWKDNRDNRLHIGGIADDIQQVLPEVVYKTNDGVLTMDYGNAAFAIASSLIKPVVDHEKRIAILEEENKQLRREVERLKSA